MVYMEPTSRNLTLTFPDFPQLVLYGLKNQQQVGNIEKLGGVRGRSYPLHSPSEYIHRASYRDNWGKHAQMQHVYNMDILSEHVVNQLAKEAWQTFSARDMHIMLTCCRK